MQSPLDELLARMTDIAEVVNSFNSEAVQLRALDAIMQTAGVSIAAAGAEPEARRDDGGEPERSASKAKGSTKASTKAAGATPRRARKAASNPTHLVDLNLRPHGKTSLKDFVAAKRPGNQSEQNLLCVYYLKHELDIAEVSQSHIFTCYREMKEEWRIPANLANSLQKSASVDGYLKTADMENIILTSTGTNTVEHDLPRPTKQK